MLQNQGDSLLFSIDDDPQNPVYIQGTFHFAESGLYPLDSFMMEKFDQSQVVYFELKEMRDIDELMGVGSKETEKRMPSGLLKNGQTIKSLLSEQEWEILMEYWVAITEIDRPSLEQRYLLGLNRLEPWFTDIRLYKSVLVEVVKSAKITDPGVDYFLAKLADIRNKEIRALEEIAKQIDTYSNYSVEEQLASLKYNINTYNDSQRINEEKENIVDSYDAFKNKSAEGMLKSVLDEQEIFYSRSQEDKDLRSYYQKQKELIVDIRNKEWIKVIENDILKDPSKRYFIVVGSMHLVGKGSIIELLLKRGHRITQY